MLIGINDLYEKIDRAIIFLSENDWMDKWKIQKGVFYFLWLDSINNKYVFGDIAKKMQIEPNRQGPYSESIDSEVGVLIREGYLESSDLNSKILPVKSTQKGIASFLQHVKSNERFCLIQIRDILEKLESDEVVFFVYFNPYIPDDVKSYFLSRSEMKQGLILQKESYIKKLLSKEIIDDSTADKMRANIIKMQQ
jgi:hypothetical protein